MDQVVDIADFRVSNDPRTELVTYSLGSCIGVAIWDPEVCVGGMLHFMLPSSSIVPQKAASQPGMFADTGLPAMFRAAYTLGAAKHRIVVKVAGGAQLLDDHGTFNIGKRNYEALREILQKNGVRLSAADVGGTASRTLRLQIASGKITLKVRKGESEL